MGDLSRHFSRSELACPCCGGCYVEPELVRALEELRAALGHPIHPTSGWRCQGHNAAVGGAAESLHMSGTACDLVIYGLSPADVAHVASAVEPFGAGGIGLYPPWIDDEGRRRGNFVHVDVRGHFARWGKIRDGFVGYPTAVKAFGWR